MNADNPIPRQQIPELADRSKQPGALHGQVWLTVQTHQAQQLIHGREGTPDKPPIIGAMIIAPLIAGALFAISPNVAMAVDNASRKKKLIVGIDAAFISVANCSGAMRGSNSGCHSPVRRRSMD
jgi:hypothetical protein